MDNTFVHDDKTYRVVVPSLRFKGRTYQVSDLLQDDNEAVRAALVEHTWKGKNGKRDEEEYGNNGILNLVY